MSLGSAILVASALHVDLVGRFFSTPWALYFVPGFLSAPAVLWLLLIVYVWLRT